MKRKKIYILLLLTSVLLASCKVGKSYVRPEMALPDSLAQQQDSISIADEQWQAVYTDHTLRSLIAHSCGPCKGNGGAETYQCSQSAASVEWKDRGGT